MYNYLRSSPLRYLSHLRLSLALSFSLTPYGLIALSFSHTYAPSFFNATLTLRYPSLTFASSYASSCVSHIRTVLVPRIAPSFLHLRTVFLTRIAPSFSHAAASWALAEPLHLADPSSIGSPSPRVTSLTARARSPRASPPPERTRVRTLPISLLTYVLKHANSAYHLNSNKKNVNNINENTLSLLNNDNRNSHKYIPQKYKFQQQWLEIELFKPWLCNTLSDHHDHFSDHIFIFCSFCNKSVWWFNPHLSSRRIRNTYRNI